EELTERPEADSEFPAPNETSVSRTDPPSSRVSCRFYFQHVLLPLPLAKHDRLAADGVAQAETFLVVLHAFAVDVDPAAANQTARFTAGTREPDAGHPARQRILLEIGHRHVRGRHIAERGRQL